MNFIKTLLPITKTIVEANNFDIQKIKNPDIKGTEYQNGEMKNFYNVREYIYYIEIIINAGVAERRILN